MTDKNDIIKHLEITQGVITRLAHNSFLVKGWSMAILAAGIIFIARLNIAQSEWIMLTFLIPVIGFAILDGYFLWQERLFRQVYNDVRKQTETDFDMNPMKHMNKPNCSWRSATFSITIMLFYGIEIVFISAVFVALILSKNCL